MNHQSSDCPKMIANALFQIQGAIDTLGYDSDNNFANYRYVSIDKYYQEIRPLMNEAGILIIPDELESSVSDDRKLYRAVYQFTILHKDGAVWNFPIRRSITLPFTGAQSAGSALSYLEKITMRTIFKINSADQDSIDADSLEKVDFSTLTEDQKAEIDKAVEEAEKSGNFTDEDWSKLRKWQHVENIHDIQPEHFDNVIKGLNKIRDRENDTTEKSEK